jgi:PT repeat
VVRLAAWKERFVGWMVCWSVGWMVCWLVGRMFGLLGCFAGWLLDWEGRTGGPIQTKRSQPTKQPNNQPTNQPLIHGPTKREANHQTNRGSQPFNQSTNQPTNQPTNQSTNQPTNQPCNLPNLILESHTQPASKEQPANNQERKEAANQPNQPTN